MSASPTRTMPASNASSPPTTCNSVLLPTPDAPTIATISPDSTDKSRSCNTVSGPAAVRYDFTSPRTSMNGMTTGSSLIPEGLGRIEPARLSRRINRGDDAHDNGRDNHDDNVERLHAERQIRDLI